MNCFHIAVVKKEVFTLLLIALFQNIYAQQGSSFVVGAFPSHDKVVVAKTGNGWGLMVESSGLNAVVQPVPIQLEFYTDSAHIDEQRYGYQSVIKRGNGFTGTKTIVYKAAKLHVSDAWTITGNSLQLLRKIIVSGNEKGGFMSAVTLQSKSPQRREDLDYFAPGIMYGAAEHLTEGAIGGKKFQNHIRIREDRLPAPLFGIYFRDQTSLTVLDPVPNGATTLADANDTKAQTLIEEGLQTGAIGVDHANGTLETGFWFPGTEGEVTYRGNTYPGGQMQHWRRRYHPLKNGFIQNYQVVFRFAQQPSFPDYYSHAWRWAFTLLKPRVNYHDIEAARRSLIDMLGDRVVTENSITGLPNWETAAANDGAKPDRKTIMGFTGKTLEAANFLLQDAARDTTGSGRQHRQQALAVIQTFLGLKLAPPEGEGFNFGTGGPDLAIPHEKRVYLRSFGDDLKALLKAEKREKVAGREHADWIAWARSFADWLLPQQNNAGGFPRTWKPVTGEVIDTSSASSYTVIPYLLLLAEATGEQRYKEAAIKAGRYCLRSNAGGVFVGGTIDNPNVIDKEAGTLSLEAYLALYDVTKEAQWLTGAKEAADFSETWMYIWNVPMPADADNALLHWKRGISTVGLQLISSGHSLVDMYMAFDVDEYAKLFKLLNDVHYYDVARQLLHNTKSMLALPGRMYDLKGPGWQQEHWSLAPHRGFGLHRGWLPWVSTSHLNGIFGLEELDKALYNQLIKPDAEK